MVIVVKGAVAVVVKGAVAVVVEGAVAGAVAVAVKGAVAVVVVAEVGLSSFLRYCDSDTTLCKGKVQCLQINPKKTKNTNKYIKRILETE